MYGNTRPSGRTDTGQGSDRFPLGTADRELNVVSNRQPYRHEYTDDGAAISVDRPTGGLTAGLDPVLQTEGGTWIAWGDGNADADVVDTDCCVSVPPDDPEYTLRRVWLSSDQERDYYYGFSNQVLWPLCHGALTNVRYKPSFARAYRRTNEQFAAAAADQADPGSLLWFQDYHLALAPRLARRRLHDDVEIVHFWHIPWPSPDVFRNCPDGRELLRGLLGNDVLGFHVERYRTNFLRCVDSLLDGATVDWRAKEASYDGRVTRTDAVPMGVPFDRIQEQAAGETAESFRSSFDREHGIADDTRIAVGVDRLDYSKGIPERLRALERFWEVNPDWRGALTYVQNASESRSRIPAYREVQERVVEAVERINGRFGTADWQPVIYGTETLDREELYGLYRRADLALVSPISDGMNLVALEYVAAQLDRDGVLVLGEGAGAHDEIGEHAVSISPYDTDQFADGIARALTMPRDERRRRMDRLRAWVADNDLDTWVARLLDSAEPRPGTGAQRTRSETPPT